MSGKRGCLFLIPALGLNFTIGCAPRANLPVGQAPAPSIENQRTPGDTPAHPAGEQAAYQQAFELLKTGGYNQARAAFNDFVVRFPNSAYADNAQYWLGETYYVERQFAPAIAEYEKLVQNYPQSQKLSHALLKIGYSYSELGQIDKARAALQELKSRYPGTAAARLAEERLQRIGPEHP